MSVVLFDLTAKNVAREMRLHDSGSVLVEPTFRRHVDRVTTMEERTNATDRLARLREAGRREAA